jgi:hypothetical protein
VRAVCDRGVPATGAVNVTARRFVNRVLAHDVLTWCVELA